MLVKMNKTFPTFWDDFFGKDYYPANYNSFGFKNTPAVNIVEGDNEFTIEVAAPGLDKKDFKVDLENDRLTISSARDENNEEIVEAYKQDVEFFTAAVELLEEECPFHLRMLELRK